MLANLSQVNFLLYVQDVEMVKQNGDWFFKEYEVLVLAE